MAKAALCAMGAAMLASCMGSAPQSVVHTAAAKAASCLEWPQDAVDAVDRTFSERNKGTHYDFYLADATIVKVRNGECFGFAPATFDSGQLGGTSGLAVIGLRRVVARTGVLSDGTQVFIVATGQVYLLEEEDTSQQA